MGNWSDDISSSVFRRAVTSLNGQVAMSGKMLDLLILLDGHTSVREVSQKMNISMSELRPLLSKLVSSGIVEEAQENIDPQFFGYLVGRLSRVAGPIARMMVEDAVFEMGGGTAQIPKRRGEELVEVLGRQIPNPKQKAAFIQEMIRKLNET